MHTLSKELISELKRKNLKISFAESCTGGAMASALIDEPGASNVIEYGFVVYSPEAKTNVLGVFNDTIKKYGVVSQEVAKEMALGALKKSSSNLAISVTGCAGPGPDDYGNEEGTICFCFAFDDGKIITEKLKIDGRSRNEIRTNAVYYAFKRILILLKNY